MFGIEKGEFVDWLCHYSAARGAIFCFNIAPPRFISNKTFCNNALGVIDSVFNNQFMQKELQVDILGA